jgi:hypothetical protein
MLKKPSHCNDLWDYCNLIWEMTAGIEPSAKISLAGLTLEYTIGFGRNNKKQATNIKVIDRGKYIK